MRRQLEKSNLSIVQSLKASNFLLGMFVYPDRSVFESLLKLLTMLKIKILRLPYLKLLFNLKNSYSFNYTTNNIPAA